MLVFKLMLVLIGLASAQEYANLIKIPCGTGECVSYKDYYLSKISAHWFGAWSYCLAVGLEFLSFDSKVEQDLFVKLAAKQSGMFNPGYGFVGAIKSVQGNASSYIWVTTNQALRYNLSWSSTNPDNWGGNEHCLNVQAWTPEFVFNDITCDSDYLPFICQKTKPRTG